MATTTSAFVLGVDLDGVCADYTKGFRNFCAERLNRDPATLPLERSWDFREWGFDDAQFEEMHAAAITEGRLLANLEVIDGAAESLWRLSDAGVWTLPSQLLALTPRSAFRGWHPISRRSLQQSLRSSSAITSRLPAAWTPTHPEG